MALGTGQLSLGDIADEYGGSAPHALSEYYSKGNAPGSGEIQIHADFNGTANVFNYVISSNASQLNLRSGALAAGWDGSAPVNATINSGVVIYSGSTGSYAMVINGSWAGGVTLNNNGTILGRGGNGGHGSTSGCHGCGCSGGVTRGQDGGSGGPALQISSAVTIANAGRISGGGGGGGGGGSYSGFGIHGGGGGAGGGGGSGGGAHSGSTAGGSSSYTSAGSGGAGQCHGGGCNGWCGGTGGSGGSYAASGSAGAVGYDAQFRGSGGGAGAATSGQSNVTWSATGTRNGSLG